MGNINNTFAIFCREQHDIVCNQKYGREGLPYSFHLKMVAINVRRFKHLLGEDEFHPALEGAWGHDLIEDANVTYNDIKDRAGEVVADIIYCCTEEKGRTRDERHSDKFFKELSENNLAVYVKLCDIIANVTYSLLTDSSMYGKYKKEFPRLKKELGRAQFKEMFDYLERLLTF